MTGKIDKMTPEQEQKMKEYRDEWLAIGLSTESIDMKEVEEAVTDLYALINRPKPEIVYCRSPKEMITLPEMKPYKENGNPKDGFNNNYFWEFQGMWGLYWLSFYDFPDKHIKPGMYSPEHRHALDVWIRIAKCLAGFVAYDTHCFVSDRPIRLTRDDQGRLHNEETAALEYKDGYKIFAIHGVVIPREKSHIVTDPSKITLQEIESEENGEIKRVAMERFGWDRYLEASGATLIDEYTDQLGFPVKLWEKDLGRDFEEKLVMIELVNSTIEGLFQPDGSFIPDLKDGQTYHKKYRFCVPPTIKSAKEAHAWHTGLDNVKEVEFIQQT